jgi:hypothetical protein
MRNQGKSNENVRQPKKNLRILGLSLPLAATGWLSRNHWEIFKIGKQYDK